jgi:hypothetical protein
METQQMMELLLARMNASIKEYIQEMTARTEINQTKLEADREFDQGDVKPEIRSDQEHIKEIMETQFASLAAKLDGWREEMQDDQDHEFQGSS